MLVLSFKPGEGAYVGRLGRITYLRGEEGQVKLGFEFERGIVISRDSFSIESHLEKQRAKDQAGRP